MKVGYRIGYKCRCFVNYINDELYNTLEEATADAKKLHEHYNKELLVELDYE